jgi:hypothetical protein
MQTLHGRVAAKALLRGGTQAYLCCSAAFRLRGQESTMNTRKSFARIGEFFEIFGSAVAVSRAVEGNRQPSARDLRTLGIDPAAFGKIRT